MHSVCRREPDREACFIIRVFCWPDPPPIPSHRLPYLEGRTQSPEAQRSKSVYTHNESMQTPTRQSSNRRKWWFDFVCKRSVWARRVPQSNHLIFWNICEVASATAEGLFTWPEISDKSLCLILFERLTCGPTWDSLFVVVVRVQRSVVFFPAGMRECNRSINWVLCTKTSEYWGGF